jgi:glycosyltransferase involved in cell wall biosynthesis
MDRHRIAIVIPALNEAATIHQVVSSTVQWGIPVVIDDGSSDTTGAQAAAAGAIVVRHAVCGGYDNALNSGFRRASELDCEYVITMDADGQHDPGVLGAFIRALDDGADIVVGIRDRRQRIAEHVFAWVSSFKWSIRDPLCGMKAYRIQTYRELGHFDSYESIGTELALYTAKAGKKVVQLPIKTRDRTDQARFGRRYSANKRIVRAMFCGLATHG